MDLTPEKRQYFCNIASKYDLTIEDVSAILHGEHSQHSTDLRFQIMMEAVKDVDETFFCMVWKGEPVPNPIESVKYYDYVGQILEGISLRLTYTGYALQMFLSNPTIADEDFYEYLLEKHPNAGFIHIVSPDCNVMETVCKHHNRPIIYVNYPANTDMSDKYLIDIDHRNIAETVLLHLTRLGHQHIAIITGIMDHQTAIDRVNSYKHSARKLGITLNKDLIAESNWREEGGYQVAIELMEKDPRPTAIIASNDRMAIGVIKAIKDLGLRVPQDVSVVGYDDITSATSIQPNLTTVRLPMTRIGRESAGYLIALLEGGNPYPQHYTLPLELIIRDSTGPASG